MSDSGLVGVVDEIVVAALAAQDEFARDRDIPRLFGAADPNAPKEPNSEVVTRDIINAIADELGRFARSKELGVSRAGGVGYSATWLRSQASTETSSHE